MHNKSYSQDRQNRRAVSISLLVIFILCIPLCVFVLSSPPKTFFFWLNDGILTSAALPTKEDSLDNWPFGVDDDDLSPKFKPTTNKGQRSFFSSDEKKSSSSGSTENKKRDDNEEDTPLLLLISYDAFRYDYIEKHKNVTPTLQWLIKNGVYAKEGLKNTFITITAPNHYGIVTGLYEENHGIIANSFFDPAMNESFDYFNTRWATNPKFFGGNPIWITNDEKGQQQQQQQGVPTKFSNTTNTTSHNDNKDESKNKRATGCMMWVGCDVPINNKSMPAHRVSWDENLDWLARVDSVVSWFTDKKRPVNFGLLYIEEPDETGHRFGPDSPEIGAVLRKLDLLTTYLLWRLHISGLLDRMNIIFTADHGMSAVPSLNVVNMDKYLNRSMYTVYGGSPNWNVQPAAGMEEKVYNTLHNKVPHLNVYNKSNIPEDFHYRNNKRIMPLQLVSDVHWAIAFNFTHEKNGNNNNNENTTEMKNSSGVYSREMYIRGQKRLFNYTSSNYTTGEHGYNNSFPEMHPYFIATGPAFKEGYNVTAANQFMNLDLYELMCYILKLQPSPNNGSFERIRHILKDEGVKWLKKSSAAAASSSSSKKNSGEKFAGKSFWNFASLAKDPTNGDSNLDSDFNVDYEYGGIKTNLNYDLMIMLLILSCYVGYMLVLVRSAKRDQFRRRRLVEEECDCGFESNVEKFNPNVIASSNNVKNELDIVIY